MGWALLCAPILFLAASGGESKEPLGQMCRLPTEGAFQCPGSLEFCCGTCSAPYCCATREKSLDAIRCPEFRQGMAATAEPRPEETSIRPTPNGKSHPKETTVAATAPKLTLAPERKSRVNLIWVFVGMVLVLVAIVVMCRTYARYHCSLRRCCEGQEDAQPDSPDPPVRPPVPGFPPHLPPPPPPPLPLVPLSLQPPPYEDPPPYSVADPLRPLAVPLAMTNILHRTTPEGRAQPVGREWGALEKPAGGKRVVPYLELAGGERVVPELEEPAGGGQGTLPLPEPAGGERVVPYLEEPAGREGGTLPLPEPAGGEGGTLPLPEPDGREGGTLPLPEPYGGEGVVPKLEEPAGRKGGTLPLPEPAGGKGGTLPLPEPSDGEGLVPELEEPAGGEGATLPEPAGGEGATLPEPAGGEGGTLPLLEPSDGEGLVPELEEPSDGEGEPQWGP